METRLKISRIMIISITLLLCSTSCIMMLQPVSGFEEKLEENTTTFQYWEFDEQKDTYYVNDMGKHWHGVLFLEMEIKAKELRFYNSGMTLKQTSTVVGGAACILVDGRDLPAGETYKQQIEGIGYERGNSMIMMDSAHDSSLESGGQYEGITQFGKLFEVRLNEGDRLRIRYSYTWDEVMTTHLMLFSPDGADPYYDANPLGEDCVLHKVVKRPSENNVEIHYRARKDGWYGFLIYTKDIMFSDYILNVDIEDNDPPVLSQGSVSPESGNTNMTYEYTVDYQDPNDDMPKFVDVVVDGKEYAMTRSSSQTRGNTETYIYKTKLPPGDHTYYFKASDGFLDVRLPSEGHYEGPSVMPVSGNDPPILVEGDVDPESGTMETSFTYSVKYSDNDDDAPSYVNVNIDGTSYNMTMELGTGTNFTTGVYYQYSTTLGPGDHEFFFITSDGSASGRYPPQGAIPGPFVTGGPEENKPPELAFGEVSPSSGNETTIFTYRVVYIDENNDQPEYVKVSIDGSDYDMEKLDGLSTGYNKGVVYKYDTPLLTGSHTYHFSASDGEDTGRFPGTGESMGPDVSQEAVLPASLANGTVTPSKGTPFTNFTYTVEFIDPMERDPDEVKVLIDGVPFDMVEDGGRFVYGTELDVGEHRFRFTARVGDEMLIYPSGMELSGPVVENRSMNSKPELSAGNVSPVKGNESTIFYFTVIYRDRDADAPDFVRVMIDGVSHEMKQGSNDSVADFTKGVSFVYSTNLSEGNHTFGFVCSDGNYEISLPEEGNYSGPDVSRIDQPVVMEEEKGIPVLFIVLGFVLIVLIVAVAVFFFLARNREDEGDLPKEEKDDDGKEGDEPDDAP